MTTEELAGRKQSLDEAVTRLIRDFESGAGVPVWVRRIDLFQVHDGLENQFTAHATCEICVGRMWPKENER